MEPDYTKREMDEHFKDISNRITENTDITKELSVKVGIQNGRVGKLEGKFNSVALASTAAFFLIGIIMSLVVYSFNVSQDRLKAEILLQISEEK
jgi:hypothetical protein